MIGCPDCAQRAQDSAKDELFDLMSAVSEDCFHTNWFGGLEFDLWEMVAGDNTNSYYGLAAVEPHIVEALKTFAKNAGGWWTWPAGSDVPVFKPTNEWIPFYEDGCDGSVQVLWRAGRD